MPCVVRADGCSHNIQLILLRRQVRTCALPSTRDSKYCDCRFLGWGRSDQDPAIRAQPPQQRSRRIPRPTLPRAPEVRLSELGNVRGFDNVTAA